MQLSPESQTLESYLQQLIIANKSATAINRLPQPCIFLVVVNHDEA